MEALEYQTVTDTKEAWSCAECGAALRPLEDDIHWNEDSDPVCQACAAPEVDLQFSRDGCPSGERIGPMNRL